MAVHADHPPIGFREEGWKMASPIPEVSTERVLAGGILATIYPHRLPALFMTDKVRGPNSVQIQSDYRRNCAKFRSESEKQDCKECPSGALIDFPCAQVDRQIRQLHGMIKAAYYFPTKSNLSSDLTTVNKALTFQPAFRFRRGPSPALAAAL